MEEVRRKVQHIYETDNRFMVDELLKILKNENPEALVTIDEATNFYHNPISVLKVEFWEEVPHMTKLVAAKYEEDDVYTIEAEGGSVVFKDSSGRPVYR